MSLLGKINAHKQAHPELASALPVREGERICALPRTAGRQVDMGPYERPNCEIALWPLQKQALAAIQDHKGLLGPIGVGHGKTYVALLAGMVAGAKRTILMAPPATIANLRHCLATVAHNFTLDPSSVVLMPYSRLSLAGGEEELRSLAAGWRGDDLALICDEAHLLKRPVSARTQRVMRFVGDYDPIFVALSGTMTARKISDFAHLADMALGDNSPVPRAGHPGGRQLLRSWGDVLDADGQRRWWNYCDMDPLRSWANLTAITLPYPTDRDVEECRAAFSERLRTCPGVVASKASAIGTSLHIETLNPVIPTEIFDAIKEVRRTGQDPSGNELPDPVALWRCMNNLSLGFFYTWEWPGGDVDYEWLDARNDWNRHVRSEIECNGRAGYDSPLLVFNAIEREAASGRSEAIHQAWREWVRVKERPAPPVKTNWIDETLLPQIVNMVSMAKLGSQPPILFYADRAVGKRLESLLPTYRPGDAIDTSKAHSCAASIKSHGTGLNLQPWDTMVVLGMPSSGQIWEQLLGRLHRPGSPHDRISVFFLAHTAAYRRGFESACRDAAYIEATTGNRQKLMAASHGERLLNLKLKLKGK